MDDAIAQAQMHLFTHSLLASPALLHEGTGTSPSNYNQSRAPCSPSFSFEDNLIFSPVSHGRALELTRLQNNVASLAGILLLLRVLRFTALLSNWDLGRIFVFKTHCFRCIVNVDFCQLLAFCLMKCQIGVWYLGIL